MRLVDLVSVLIDHDSSENNTGLVKGQAAVSDKLFAMIEEQAVYCIEQGMGEQMAHALQRLAARTTPPPSAANLRSARSVERHRSWFSRAIPTHPKK